MVANELLETLRDLETELHRAETRRNRSRLNELLHPHFEEFGRTGRAYSREEVLSAFAATTEYPTVLSRDFKLAKIGDGVALLTYISAYLGDSGEQHRQTLRSSVWVLSDGGWQMRFHQGTPAAD